MQQLKNSHPPNKIIQNRKIKKSNTKNIKENLSKRKFE